MQPTGALQLNLFRVTRERSEVSLPALEFNDAENGRKQLDARFRDHVALLYSYKPPVYAVFIDGPEMPDGTLREISLSRDKRLERNWILHAVRSHFRAEGMRLEDSRFGLTVLRPQADFHHGPLSASAGIHVRVKTPFSGESAAFLLVSWTIKTEFDNSLADDRIRRISAGCGVSYAPSADAAREAPALRVYENRFLGRVVDVGSATAVPVRCRDGVVRRISPSALWLEASPSAIRQYEQSIDNGSAHSIWRRVQQLSFVLDANARRSRMVVKNRMSAIQQFLGGSSVEQLDLPRTGFDPVGFSVALSPLRLETD